MPQMKAEDVRPDGRLFALFVGGSGSGKSCASMSVLRKDPSGSSRQGKVFDFDLRKGYLGQDYLDLKPWRIESYPPLTTYAKDVEKELESLHSLFQARQWPYDTLVFASLQSLCRILITDAQEFIGGSVKGNIRLSGPPDYKYESTALLQLFDYLRSLPCNVIIECQISDRWGPGTKKDARGNLIEYQDAEVVGEQLTITRNLGEIVLGYFDEIYRFSKSPDGEKRYVEFFSNIARSVYKLPRGKQDITGKAFYPYWVEQVNKLVPKAQGVTS